MQKLKTIYIINKYSMINSSSIVTLPPEIYFSEPNRYISSATYNPKEKKSLIINIVINQMSIIQ